MTVPNITLNADGGTDNDDTGSDGTNNDNTGSDDTDNDDTGNGGTNNDNTNNGGTGSSDSKTEQPQNGNVIKQEGTTADKSISAALGDVVDVLKSIVFNENELSLIAEGKNASVFRKCRHKR